MEQSKDRTLKKPTGFSISSIMGFLGKELIVNSNRETSKDSQDEQRIYENSPKAEKAKKVKRSLNDPDGKRYRATFDKAQISHMERAYRINHYPDVTARSVMSKATALSHSQVQIWFQNRRAKWRKQQRKRREDVPPMFGHGYPTHLARVYPRYDPFAMFPYEYYNTDFWTCAQQHFAAMHYTGIPAPRLAMSSPARSRGSNSPISSAESSPGSPSINVTSPLSRSEDQKPEIRNDSSLLALRLKAREHMAAMETSVMS